MIDNMIIHNYFNSTSHMYTIYCTSNSKPVQKLSTRNKPNDFLNTSLPHLFLKQRFEYLNDFHQFFLTGNQLY